MTYPATLDAAEDLLVALNSFRTQLVTGIGTSDTSVTVLSVAGLQTTNGLLSIDSEIIGYTAINTAGANPVLTGVTRGVDGTSPASHGAGADVEVRWVAAHHNRLVSLLLAIETALGPVPATDGINSQTFTSLAARLTATLPRVITRAPSTDWSFVNDRKRIVGVQCWKKVGGTYQVVTPTVLNQNLNTGGDATVTVQFSSSTEGYIVVS